MFAGLFVVVHAFEVTVVQTWGIDRWQALLDSPVVAVSGLSVVALEPGLERAGGPPVQAADGGDGRGRIASRPGWPWRCRAPWPAT